MSSLKDVKQLPPPKLDKYETARSPVLTLIKRPLLGKFTDKKQIMGIVSARWKKQRLVIALAPVSPF